jgi:hypothetical protein
VRFQLNVRPLIATGNQSDSAGHQANRAPNGEPAAGRNVLVLAELNGFNAISSLWIEAVFAGCGGENLRR